MLQAVLLEVFKPKDVQHSDVLVIPRAADDLVYLGDNVCEELSIDRLGQGITRVLCLPFAERREDALAPNDIGPLDQRAREVVSFNAQDLGGSFKHRAVGNVHDHVLLWVVYEHDVAEVEKSGRDTADRVNLLGREHGHGILDDRMGRKWAEIVSIDSGGKKREKKIRRK